MKVLAYLKTRIKQNKNSVKLNKKRGSELAETVLVTAIMVVVIVTIFYPQIQTIFTGSISKLSGWFDKVLTTI